jgi:hypothetical protein
MRIKKKNKPKRKLQEFFVDAKAKILYSLGLGPNRNSEDS